MARDRFNINTGLAGTTVDVPTGSQEYEIPQLDQYGFMEQIAQNLKEGPPRQPRRGARAQAEALAPKQDYQLLGGFGRSELSPQEQIAYKEYQEAKAARRNEMLEGMKFMPRGQAFVGLGSYSFDDPTKLNLAQRQKYGPSSTQMNYDRDPAMHIDPNKPAGAIDRTPYAPGGGGTLVNPRKTHPATFGGFGGGRRRQS
jgi:hypothetical protein